MATHESPVTPEPRLAPAVRPGDRVRLVSPASSPSIAWLTESIAILESWGLIVEVGTHAMDQWGYMAGRDHERLADLNDAFRDPGVRAIITTRGGAGAYRIADRIDFDAVRRDPKPVVGFSDITNVHLALWKHAHLPTVHGCLAGPNAQASVHHLLTSNQPLTIIRDEAAYSAAVSVPGHATGPLIGGNLRETAGSVGVRLPSMEGAILFLEDERKIGLGQVDRQLNHLIRSGSLDGIVGVALGLFTGFADYVDRGWTLLDVLNDRLGALGVPILGGLTLGHGGIGVDGGPDQFAATIGAAATIDATVGTLTVGPCVWTS
jgi:muramoyltetrapeptide carboxypeptidase